MNLLDAVKQFRAHLPIKQEYQSKSGIDCLLIIQKALNAALPFELTGLFNKCLQIKNISNLVCVNADGMDSLIDYSCLMEITDLMEKFAKNIAFL